MDKLTGVLMLGFVACGNMPPVVVPPASGGPPARVAQISYHAEYKKAIEPTAVADSLIMVASWANPVDDGRGTIDSIRVRFLGIFLDSTVVFRSPTLGTTATVRQMIPPQAYGGVGSSAQFDVLVQIQAWRRATFSSASSASVRIDVNDTAPPAVSGINFSATKKP